jgi:hypothetical protein
VFRIEFFVDDKKLAQAVRGLLGVAMGDPKITPVINAEVKQGKVKQISDGTMSSMLMAYLNKSHKETITPREVGVFLQENGFSKASAHYTLRQCTDQHFLRKTGKGNGTVYYVVRALPKPATNGKKG